MYLVVLIKRFGCVCLKLNLGIIIIIIIIMNFLSPNEYLFIYLFFPYILYFSTVFYTGERFRQKAKSKIQKRSELGGF